MKYYLISVLEYRFGIITKTAPEEIKKSDFDFEPVFLFPSLGSDFEIRVRTDKSEDEFYVATALSALKKYFFEIRALPLDEIEIHHSVSNFKIKNDGKIIVNLPKSKAKFTKTRMEILGCELECASNSEHLIFESENVECFDEKTLGFALMKESPPLRSALVYSLAKDFIRVKRCGEGSILESAFFLSSLLCENGEFKNGLEINFDFSSVNVRIRNLGNNKFEAFLNGIYQQS